MVTPNGLPAGCFVRGQQISASEWIRRRRRKAARGVAASLAAVVVASILITALLFSHKLPSGHDFGFSDPDRRAVKEYLGRKYPTAKYRIVEWYASQPAAECRRYPTELHYPEQSRLIRETWMKPRGDRALRAKIGFTSPIGGEYVRDMVFLIDSRGVVDTEDTSDFRFPGESIDQYADRLRRAL